MSVKVSNVTKVYGKQKALDEVSFEVNTGQVVGFLGPNGAGKSTMMKIICCFSPQTLGDVSVNGHDTLEESVEVRRLVGYLPEHNPLYHDMYVKEYLAFIAGMHKLSKEKIEKRVAQMIEITGLGLEQKK
ncbi:MAG: ATP-binding cassette domain-containing protein, partial [Bacteroidia bacterium]